MKKNVIKEIEYPYSVSAVQGLKVGDMVSLTGCVFTGRDRFHKHLFEGGKSPVDLKGAALYHCGPVVVKREKVWQVNAAGPTTSMRQELFMADIIEKHSLRVIIGKGGMGEMTRKACMKHGCVYLQAVGGAAALHAESIQEVTAVHFLKEFGMADAVWELMIKDFKAVVAMDVSGRSLHKRVATRSRRILKDLLSVDSSKASRS